MQKALIVIVLSTLLASSLSGLAQDENADTAGVDHCVATAVEDWSLPQTLDELIALRDAVEDLIAQCKEAGTEEHSNADSSQTLYVNTSAGQVNMRSAPQLSASVVARIAHGDPVESLGEANGDEFGDSTTWYHVRVEDGEGYIHSLLLSATRPVSDSTVSAVQGTSAHTVTWHEGHPSTGTCKDNIRQGRIYLGCGYEDREKVKDHLWGMPCNHPVFDAFGYGPPGEGYRFGIVATGKHARWRDDDVNGTQCALHS